MVKLAVEKIRDLQIRSTVNLERYSEGVRRKVIGILNDTQDDILAELMKQDTKVPITEWRKGRLTNLQKTIDGIADKSYGKIKRITNKDLNSITSFTAKETVGNLNKVIGAEIANVTLTPEGLKSIVSNTMIDGQVIGKWWDEQKADFKRKAARQMADATHAVQLGMVKGEGIGELVRRIRGTALAPGIMDMSKRNATSLVRTSVMQVANEARMDMYEGNGDLIDGYEIVETLDKRTCPICRAYDGKQWVKKDGKLVAKGHRLRWPGPHPLHWQCRGTKIPILKSFADLAGPKSTIPKSKIRKLEKLTPAQRAAMTYDEKLLGIGKPVSGGMTYNDWLLTQPEAVQIDVLGPGRFRLWKKHKLSMADMVNQKGRPLSIADLEKKYAEEIPVFTEFENTQNAIRWADKNFESWEKKISQGERGALIDYQLHSYKPMNDALRRGIIPEKYAKDVVNMDSVIKKGVVDKNVRVFRGTSDRSWLEKLKVGDTVIDNGFVSTTLTREGAGGYLGTRGAFMVIDIPKGTNAAWMNALKNIGEEELILPRGLKMVIKEINTAPGQPWVVILEVK